MERNRRRTCNRCRRSRMVIVYTIQYNNNNINIVVNYYSKNNSRFSYDFGCLRWKNLSYHDCLARKCRITTENEKQHEPGNHCASSRMQGIICVNSKTAKCDELLFLFRIYSYHSSSQLLRVPNDTALAKSGSYFITCSMLGRFHSWVIT